MKVEELRIGNYHKYYEGQHEGYIIGLKISDLSVNDQTVTITAEGGGYTKTEAKDVSGVKLTEMWLDKFGFKTFGDGSFDKGIEDFRITPEYEIRWKGKIIMEAPEYVHELQTLYFALTGKELKHTGQANGA